MRIMQPRGHASPPATRLRSRSSQVGIHATLSSQVMLYITQRHPV